MNHLIFIVLDSCRFDSYRKANTPNFDRIGEAEKRFSYASWTSPSHQVLLMGILPHCSPREVFASEVYRYELMRWRERTGIGNLDFSSFVPNLSLVRTLRNSGYYCVGRVSLPVLNEHTGFSRFFDDYRLMENHNSFHKMVEELDFSMGVPMFYFLNLGETHYPYMLDDPRLPHIHGVHGVMKSLATGEKSEQKQEFISKEVAEKLHQQQVIAVEYVDQLMAAVIEKVPENTYFVVCADHGEAFGEDGYFGHGPIHHPAVFEVPFVEGKRPK